MPQRRWTLGAALAIGMLVLLAAAPLWWQPGQTAVAWLAAAAALALGATTLVLLRRATRESRNTSPG